MGVGVGVGGLIVRLFWEKILPDTDPDTAPAGDYGDADDDEGKHGGEQWLR